SRLSTPCANKHIERLRKFIEYRFYFPLPARASSLAQLIWADEWFTSTASAWRECRKKNGASSLQPAAPTCHRNRRSRVERSSRRQTRGASDSSDAGAFSRRVSCFEFPTRSR